MHPHATIADHNLGIDFVNNTCVSQQIFVLFNMNRRIRVLSLMSESLKDTDSTAPKRGSVFIGLMSPDSAILSRYQRAVFMR